MLSFWQHLLNRLRAVPAGVWAALGVATTLLGLYLRGRRLQAELAKAQLDASVAIAASAGAQDLGKAMVHIDNARIHSEKAATIEAQLKVIETAGVKEQARIHAMPPKQVTSEYLERIKASKPQ